MVSFFDVGLLVVFAALSGILAVRFRIPPVLALLSTGVAIGPNALGLISSNEIVSLFAEIGAILLLFTIGAEFSISKLRQYGAKAFSIGLIKLAIVFWFSYQVSMLLGLGSLASLYLAAILSITSTALTVKLLEQKGLAHRQEVPVLVAALVIEDIFAIFALAFFSGANNAAAGSLELLTSILVAMATLGIAYFVVITALNKGLSWIAENQAEETILFLGFALAIGFSFLAQAVGLSTSIGAFLAGSLVASLPKGKVLEQALTPFTLALSSIFFLSVGLAVNLNAVASNALLIVFFVVLGILLKFVATGISTYFNGFDSRSATFAAIAMVPTGEFSLIIAAEGAKAVPGLDLVGLTSTLVFVSTVVMSLSIRSYPDIHALVSRMMPIKLQSSGRQTALRLNAILGVFSTMPQSLRLHFQSVKSNAGWTSIVVGVAAFALVLFRGKTVAFAGMVLPAYAVILAAALVMLTPFLRRLLLEFGTVFSYVQLHARRYASARNTLIFLSLVVLLLIEPFLLPFAGKEITLWNWALPLTVIAAVWYAFNLNTPEDGKKLWPFRKKERGLGRLW